ncbi:leucine-rich repeat domain-containing protein [Myxosarcina sp. GI1(2024)]
MRSLSLGNNPIKDISPLANLHELEELLRFNTSVADIAPLKNLAQLTWLNLYNTPVAETTGLARLSQLPCATRECLSLLADPFHRPIRNPCRCCLSQPVSVMGRTMVALRSNYDVSRKILRPTMSRINPVAMRVTLLVGSALRGDCNERR